MNKKTILGLLLILNFAYGDQISQIGVATASSKLEACQEALLQAQQEALHESGINIFTSISMKQTVINDVEIKKIITDDLQKSYGYITTISKNETTDYNSKTGYITCKVNGIFEVDTSKLKSQLLALSKKYNNQYEVESSRAKALREKNELMQKYSILKDNITRSHSFKYNGSYNCGDNLGLNECTNQLHKKIRNYMKKKLAKKYNIESSLINMDEIELKDDIQSTTMNGLIVKYNGMVEANALSVKNPYIDEINSLNAFLGEEEIYDEDTEPKGPSFGEKFTETMSDIGNSIAERQYMIFYSGFGAGDFLFDWMAYDSYDSYDELSHSNKSQSSSIEFYAQLTPTSPFMLKLGQGTATYKITSSYDGYAYPTEHATDKDYSFDYYMVGLSVGDGKKEEGWIGLDVDYIIPSASSGSISNVTYNDYARTVTSTTNINETINPFVNFSVNIQGAPFHDAENILIRHFAIGAGLHYSTNEAMKDQWITLKAGMIF